MAGPGVLLQIEGFEDDHRVVLSDDRSDDERAINGLFRELSAFAEIVVEGRLEETFGAYDEISTFKRPQQG